MTAKKLLEAALNWLDNRDVDEMTEEIFEANDYEWCMILKSLYRS